jgi:hypothetical protein
LRGHARLSAGCLPGLLCGGLGRFGAERAAPGLNRSRAYRRLCRLLTTEANNVVVPDHLKTVLVILSAAANVIFIDWNGEGRDARLRKDQT